MKKFLTALTLLAGLLLLPAPAQATVSCSVPFNLTNGTVADASQVMANYNAILACLSTSTASAGANTDITSLGGLTTPITPAQGGATALCGANGFAAINNTGTPLTELTLTFTQALVTNSLGAVQFGTAATLVLNFGSIGTPNGLDAGSLGASTVYYLYLIGNGTTIASLASLSASAPTLPAGYTFSCRVGAWYSTTLSQLITGIIGGNKFMLRQSSTTNTAAGALQVTTSPIGSCGNAPANDTMVLTAFSGIPVTANEAIGSVYASAGYSAVSAVGTSTPSSSEVASNGSMNAAIQFDLVMPAAQSLYLCTVNTGNRITITGWVDSVNAH
jgi:hypothetical protein